MSAATYPAYPAGTDLAAFLAATGLAVPPAISLQAKCDAAVAEWEERTGWRPYLTADTPQSPSTRLFDPPGPAASSGRASAGRGGRILYFQGGLISLNSLSVGVVPDQTGAYGGPGAQGTALVSNLNFYLRPQNAPARGLAYTEAEFIYPVAGVPQSVAIVGVWGRVAALPGDVWQGVLERAAALCAAELSLSISGGYFERRVGDSLKRFAGGKSDAGPLAQQVALWDDTFERAVRTKRRIVA